ncbi:hypothetical protein B0B36_01060 [Pseudomonas syringae pv. actinidifoliorum]|nr:hypothetical protein B0B36_01060 [Pseudomonas syringae pv. actinidifoliorum]
MHSDAGAYGTIAFYHNYRATLRVDMPSWTLCVLLRRRASRNAFRRWSVRNDSLLSQLSCDAPRRHAVLDALRPLVKQRRIVGDHTGPFANKRSVARFAPTPCGQKPENPISDADLQRSEYPLFLK